MVVDYTGDIPLGDIRDLLASGFNGGGWDGPGIISSTAFNLDPSVFGLGYGENADLPRLTARNSARPCLRSGPDATAVLIKFTWVGDLNLDGLVDFQDLSRLQHELRQRRDAAAGSGPKATSTTTGSSTSRTCRCSTPATTRASRRCRSPAALTALLAGAALVARRCRRRSRA